MPILFRLHRSEKRCKAEKRPYRKLTEHARDLVALMAQRYPQRQLELIGDSAHTDATLIKARPANVTVIGRGRLDAALYAPAPKRRPGQRGRSRVRGKRLASPAWWASRRATRWKKLEVTVYGRTVAVLVFVIDALWYVATGSEVVRLVLVRDFPGHEKDDVSVCTDPTLSPRQIIESFSKRWSLEVTFHDAKGKLGFEDPRTAPSAPSSAPPRWRSSATA